MRGAVPGSQRPWPSSCAAGRRLRKGEAGAEDPRRRPAERSGRRGGPREDTLVKLRREIVKECEDAITQHIVQMEQRTAAQSAHVIGGGRKELEDVRKAMERLKG